MGGECEAGTNGWEIGVYGNEVTEEGKKWWGDVSGQGREDRVVRHSLRAMSGADKTVRSADGMDPYPWHNIRRS